MLLPALGGLAADEGRRLAALLAAGAVSFADADDGLIEKLEAIFLDCARDARHPLHFFVAQRGKALGTQVERIPPRTMEQLTGSLRALEIALERMPDLIILDIRLPDIDGYEVLRRLRDGLSSPVALAIEGSQVFVLRNNQTLHPFDVSDPGEPVAGVEQATQFTEVVFGKTLCP